MNLTTARLSSLGTVYGGGALVIKSTLGENILSDSTLMYNNPASLTAGNVSTHGIVVGGSAFPEKFDGHSLVSPYANGTSIMSTRMPDAPVLIPGTGTVSSARYSPDGKYIAMKLYDSAPYLGIAKNNQDSITMLENVPSCGGYISQLDWTPDSRFFVVSLSDGSLKLYRNNNNDTFSLLSTLPAAIGAATGVRFNRDGSRLAVGTNLPPYVCLYSHDGNGNFALLPSSTFANASYYGSSVRWAADDSFLTVGHSNGGQVVTVYKNNGADIFEKITVPTFNAYCYTQSWSPDSKYLFVCGSLAPSVYKNNFNGTFTLIPNPLSVAVSGNGTVNSEWTPSGDLVIATGLPTPGFHRVFKNNNDDIFTAYPNEAAFVTNATGLAMHPDGKSYLVFGYSAGTYMANYRLKPALSYQVQIASPRRQSD